MEKEETSSGLLSKMVRFVRNPATSWSELDTIESNRDEAVSMLLLKEMIERKRRNDFVRKREFDMLRKMRKRESMGGSNAEARPSFFQSSMPSRPDDRAQTLKKIDEIEAQMSMQWWKTKHGTPENTQSGNSSVTPDSKGPNALVTAQRLPPPQRSTALPILEDALELLPQGYGATEPMGLQSEATANGLPGQPAVVPLMAPYPRPGSAVVTAVPVTVAVKPIAADAFSSRATESESQGFPRIKMMTVDVSEITHDAEIEEVSIQFANGDDSGAEVGMLEILTPGGLRFSLPEVWMVLFDLYRATDSQEKFETAALKFVQKFDRSAPQWFSMPEAVRLLAVLEPAAPTNHTSVDWICPSVAGTQTVAALKAALAKASMPWRLDWSNLKSIEPSAVEAFCKVFAGWSTQPVQLRFIGDAQLQQLLQKNTPSGNRDTEQDWWQLRLEVLRVTHRPDEFELTALDFCVTYEVSPPSWDNARCDYKSIDPQALGVSVHAIIGDVYKDSVPSHLDSAYGDSQLDVVSSQMSNQMLVELSGQIEGDAIEMLDRLEIKLLGADIMIISCANLIRVDFTAAGTLLNWVSARQSENRAVQFTDVNRLVAAFFNVIGITEHAKVIVRKD